MLGIDHSGVCEVVEASLMASDLAEEGTKQEKARCAVYRRVRQLWADFAAS